MNTVEIAWNQTRIEEIIKNNAEESIYLDFKASGALSNEKKKDICKDVSSFANSDGGVIIYGILEKDHKADSLSFIDGDSITKEWLEQVVNDGIQRRIDGIRIHCIRFDNDVRKTVYVLEIPISPLAPHMTKDSKYYKRFNFMSIAMEEYEVRHTYERKQNSKLDIGTISLEIKNEKNWFKDMEFEFSISFHIKNIGHAVSDYYKYRCIIKGAEGCRYSYTQFDNYNTTILQDGGFAISNTTSFPIYPDEEVCILKISLNIPFDRKIQVVESLEFDITLFAQTMKIGDIYKPGNLIDELINKLTRG